MNAIKIQKVANYFYRNNIPILPKLLHVLIRILYNSVIYPETKIGNNSNLSYGGIAVIIHKRAKIGNNVQIGSCVTVGGRSDYKEVPIIEDNVYIGSGAKILGPIRIGKGSIIGANSVVINDIPKNSVVVGIPGKIIRTIINDK